ncbi:MAG: 3-methyl-2-oxobutanoate hydroxymethyltransferase [Caldithrix sp. RBG_13_44_9]|nr:MAG: 3-methyl-2-oxobutanoate hydroxymethyltransferase [Caldithrix sp. RBG_13_44_9]
MSINSDIKKITVPDIIARKGSSRKISALTAYDFLMAEMLDEAGIDIILVGDSAGMVVAGYSTTLPVSMEEMLYHTRIVGKAVKQALVVADMPFLSYQTSLEQGILNAGRFLKEAEAQAVKIEGGECYAMLVRRLVETGIPVMGHLGLLPQSVHKYGGYKLQGKEPEIAEKLLRDARILEESGVFSIVLEKIPVDLARKITQAVKVPTIGIGAGPACDGQILVSHDMLGIYDKFKPKFVRRYAELGREMRKAFRQYIKDVQTGHFPAAEESFD